MAETKSLGQIAYEGYFLNSGGKSLITSEPLPFWNAQLAVVQRAWDAAGEAVKREISTVAAPTPLPPQTPENKSPNQPPNFPPIPNKGSEIAQTRTLPAPPSKSR